LLSFLFFLLSFLPFFLKTWHTWKGPGRGIWFTGVRWGNYLVRWHSMDHSAWFNGTVQFSILHQKNLSVEFAKCSQNFISTKNVEKFVQPIFEG
jgi:hypothetical protein